MNGLLAAWDGEPTDVRIALWILAGLTVATVLAVARSLRRRRAPVPGWWIEAPRYLGAMAILLGTFGYAVGIEKGIWFEGGGETGDLFLLAACVALAGFLGGYGLEWLARRREREER